MPTRQLHASVGSTNSSSSNAQARDAKSVVPEAQRKPVRAKPMRGPGAEEGKVSIKLRPGENMNQPQQKQQQPTSIASIQTKMKEDFCTQMLMCGYVQSFVDLFYLTHRNKPTSSSTYADPGRGDINGSTVFELAEMEFLRDQLVTAEHCKRKGEIPEVLSAYESLATYCMEKGDLKTMIFFFEKCLEIARLVKDPVCEMRVLNKIGSGYHSLQDLDKALEYQESYVAIAQVVYEHEDDNELRGDAFRQLGKVYVDLAEQCENTREFQPSIDFYKKYLDCSSKAGDTDCIGQAQFKIGVCYNALAQPANALPFLEGYLTTCRKTGNVEGEGNACAELATAHEKLENKQLSIDFLNHYISIATKAENVANQADACRRLGHIYTASQDFLRAREMHEKNYELVPAVAAQTKDATALNCSRINVGAARANDKLAVFLTLVKDDFRGLLEWKNSRTIPTVD